MEDVEKCFDSETWKTMGLYERQRYIQIYKNYLEMISFGLDIPKPDFIVENEISKSIKSRKQRKKKNMVESSTTASVQEYDQLVNVYKEFGEKGFKLNEIKLSKKRFKTISDIVKDLRINLEKMTKHCEKAHHIYILEILTTKQQNNMDNTPSTTNTRYPKRDIERIDYTEVDIPDDYYIYCDKCEREWEGCFCPFHGPLLNCPDTVVPKDRKNLMRAMQTVPVDWLCIRQSAIPNAGMGVWSIKCIPVGVRFGPYQGDESADGNNDGYCWKIRKQGRITYYVDGKSEGVSNWMRYVNCSRNIVEQNLMAFQYLGQIYYRTTRDIYPKTELLVYYGDEYGKRLGIDSKQYYTPIDKKLLPANNFPCMGCYLNFSNPIYLELHSRRCIKFRTAMCNTNTTSKDQKQNKLNNNHNGNVISEDNLSNQKHSAKNNEKKFILNESTKNKYKRDALFIQANDYKNYRGVHKNERPFKCDDCDASFTRPGYLKRHVSGVHKNERPFKCDECNASFTVAGNLKRHVRGVHKNERPFKCEECNASFTEAGNLKRHVSGVHKNERPFKCDDCDASFTRPGHLKRYVSGVHKNERPFKCDKYNASFKQTGHLRQHVSGVHKNEHPFKSDERNTSFIRECNLKVHLETNKVHKSEI